jgi:hypothetical protein
VLVPAIVAVAGLVVGVAIAGSLAHILMFVTAAAVFVSPGFFVAGRWFFGYERLLTGIALGYFLSSFVASVLYRTGALTPVSLGVGCIVIALVTALGIRPARVTVNPPSKPTHRPWLVASLALAMALVALPFLRVGQETPEGRAYRAYFSADLMTHLSVVAELQKGDFPPENPFYAGRPLGYQWLFFLFPAMVGQWVGNQSALLLTNLATSLLFAGLLFAGSRRMASKPKLAFAAVLIGLVAASYEGLAVLVRASWVGEPWGSFRDMNVDAFSRWVFELTSLDGLHRSLLYTPHHLFSYCLLLVLMLLVLRGQPRGISSSILAGALVGGMAGTSIVTAMMAGPWLIMGRIIEGGQFSKTARDILVFGSVSLICLAWYFELEFFAEAGGALVMRLPRLAELPALVFLEIGPLFLLALPGVRYKEALPVTSLTAMALMAIFMMDIGSYPGVWMAWRAGSVLLVGLALLVAASLSSWRRPVTLAVLLVPALLTVILDIYNAQDLTNREFSRGEFRWTTMVTPADYEALAWVRSHTPPEALVQWDVRARESGEWALIPALGQRRLAVGFPIFLLDNQKYRRRERRLRPIFTSADAEEAHRLATDAGIEYLIIGTQEMAVRGEHLRKLWEAPGLFKEVFSNQEATVFQVLPS